MGHYRNNSKRCSGHRRNIRPIDRDTADIVARADRERAQTIYKTSQQSTRITAADWGTADITEKVAWDTTALPQKY